MAAIEIFLPQIGVRGVSIEIDHKFAGVFRAGVLSNEIE